MQDRYPRDPFVSFPPADVERSIPERFESIARLHPGRVAIKTRTASRTYGELNLEANRVAHAVLAASGSGEGRIALLLEQGAAAIAAILGVLKAGKSYVPLDASTPRPRQLAMLEEAAPSLLVTSEQHAPLARDLIENGRRILDLDVLPPDLPTENPGLRLAPETLAEIVYTSGSTGRPKGVMHTHRTLLHHCMRVTNRFRIVPDDRLTLLASLSTGQARTVMYRGLLNGAALHLHPVKVEGLAGLAEWLRAEGTTIFSSSASVFRGFVDTLAEGEGVPTLRLIRVGSETVSARDVERYRAHFGPHCLLVNALSSTETGVTRILFMDRETPLDEDAVPVGYAVDDMETYLLDERGAPVAVGETGEIVVRSRYLSPGYWGRPDLTAAAFQPDPDGGDARLYRTGDLGRLRSDGCLLHLGRKDFRVKVRGHRIEVAEVEQALREHPAVRDVAVMTQPDHAGDSRLVAYVVPVPGSAAGARAMQDFARQRLPDHMVPTALLLLPALPLTPSGKVDRQRLPAPGPTRPPLAQPYVAPRTPVESELAHLWATMLGVEPIGIHDEFLDLGGDSLSAMRLLARVHERFRIEGPAHSLREAATVAHMALGVTERLARGLAPAERARLLADADGESLGGRAGVGTT